MESDFGLLKVVANRFSRTRDVLIFEMDKWKIAHLNGRSMVSFPLAKTAKRLWTSAKCSPNTVSSPAMKRRVSGGVF